MKKKSKKQATMNDVLGHAFGKSAPSHIDPKWGWHYRKLIALRDRLFAERGVRQAEAAEAVEPYSMNMADSASDDFEHDVALAELSAEQDAIYEIDEALKRIENGSYGICEQSGKPISANRLKAIPWTRFAAEVEARLEQSGQVERMRLGKLGSVRGERQRTLAENVEEEQAPAPEDESLKEVSIPLGENSPRK